MNTVFFVFYLINSIVSITCVSLCIIVILYALIHYVRQKQSLDSLFNSFKR